MVLHGILLPCLAGAPKCYLDMLDKLEKHVCGTVNALLAASFPLAYCGNKASLKVVSVTFLLVYFSSLKSSTCETWKKHFLFHFKSFFLSLEK